MLADHASRSPAPAARRPVSELASLPPRSLPKLDCLHPLSLPLRRSAPPRPLPSSPDGHPCLLRAEPARRPPGLEDVPFKVKVKLKFNDMPTLPSSPPSLLPPNPLVPSSAANLLLSHNCPRPDSPAIKPGPRLLPPPDLMLRGARFDDPEGNSLDLANPVFDLGLSPLDLSSPLKSLPNSSYLPDSPPRLIFPPSPTNTLHHPRHPLPPHSPPPPGSSPRIYDQDAVALPVPCRRFDPRPRPEKNSRRLITLPSPTSPKATESPTCVDHQVNLKRVVDHGKQLSRPARLAARRSSSNSALNSTTPSNPPTRRRVSMACSFCRTRKLRCTPGPGPCGHCSRRGHPCLFDNHPPSSTHSHLGPHLTLTSPTIASPPAPTNPSPKSPDPGLPFNPGG